MTAAAWVQAITAIVLVLVTGFYVYHTWHLSERTGEAAKAAQVSAEAAERSAHASEEMVNLERQREERQSQEKERQIDEERSRIAGALAAELRGLITRWREIAPTLKANLAPVAWMAEQDYFPVYDGMGPKLLLLPPELAEEVVAYYMRCKGTLDSLRGSSQLTEYYALSPDRARAAAAAELAQAQKQYACKLADELVVAVEANLLPKLDKVAKRKL